MIEMRRRAWLCREGWYYVGVLAFIVGGAILRNVNLLVVLAGMMIAPLLLNWRMVMASLRGLEVRRRAPSRISAGAPFSIDLEVANHRRYLTSRLVVFEDRITAHQPMPGEASTKTEAVLPEIPPLQISTGSYRVVIPRRGHYTLGPLRVSTRFPLGLVKANVEIDSKQELLVTPFLGRLLPNWQQILFAPTHGDQERHPQQGTSEGDYFGLRPWQMGDSRRWIHWRTTAKIGVLTVRQFERRRSQDLAIVLDPYLPENATDTDRANLELAISLTATIVADLSMRGHARLLLAIASETPELVIGNCSQPFAREVHDILAKLPSTKRPALSDAMQQLAAADNTLSGAMLVLSPRKYETTTTGINLEEPVHAGVDQTHWLSMSDPQLKNWFTLE